VELPAHSTAKLIKRSPAGSFLRINGWLFHSKTSSQLQHLASIVSIICASLSHRDFWIWKEAQVAEPKQEQQP